MANCLRMAQVQAIHVLRAQGWSFRRIGRELGIHRDTVKRYVELAALPTGGSDDSGEPADQNRPNPSTGSEGQNQPNPPAGSGPTSTAEPHREAIIGGLERGLSCQRIWQDLKTERGFAGSYDSVKRFARRLQSSTPLPFRRMECAPGEEAQIDFGTGAPVITFDGPGATGLPAGKARRRKTHVFRIVLSHSRKGYSEAVYRLRTIRELIQRQQGKQDRFEFIEEHPIIRSMADYGELVSSSFGKESAYA